MTALCAVMYVSVHCHRSVLVFKMLIKAILNISWMGLYFASKECVSCGYEPVRHFWSKLCFRLIQFFRPGLIKKVNKHKNPFAWRVSGDFYGKYMYSN